MHYKIIILNSKGGAGKDTFFKFCKEILGDCTYHISTVDCVKDLAMELGWNGEKTLRDRRGLSNLKDLMTMWGDIPYQDVKSEISDIIYEWMNGGEDFGVIFVDCREPDEIYRFNQELGAQSLLIVRDSLPTNYGNHADDDVFNYKYDYVIDNNGSLEDLKEAAKTFINEIRPKE